MTKLIQEPFHAARYWIVIVVCYYCVALWVLWHTTPIAIDGSGPLATFYWGKYSPTPTLKEYYGSLAIRLQFWISYCVASAIVTIEGCWTIKWALQHVTKIKWLGPISATGFTISLIFISAALSDVGTTIGLWYGPSWYSALSSVLVLLKVGIPISSLSGLLTASWLVLAAPRQQQR